MFENPHVLAGRLSRIAFGGVLTVATSCVPFGVLLLPPALVMLTGIPFLWVMRAMAPLAERDRTLAARIPPRAIVIA